MPGHGRDKCYALGENVPNVLKKLHGDGVSRGEEKEEEMEGRD